jgi:hypothetical protein
MLRREFIAGAALCGSLVWPLRANAQPSAAGRMRIGVLIYGSLEHNPSTQALLEGFANSAMSTVRTSLSNTVTLRVGPNGFPASLRIWFRASPL